MEKDFFFQIVYMEEFNSWVMNCNGLPLFAPFPEIIDASVKQLEAMKRVDAVGGMAAAFGDDTDTVEEK